MQLKWVKIYIT